MILALLLCTVACVKDEDKYKAYASDRVVATVNGVNIYFSELERTKVYDDTLVAGYIRLINEGEEPDYFTDEHKEELLNRKEGTYEEYLEVSIREEAIYQYVKSIGCKFVSYDDAQEGVRSGLITEKQAKESKLVWMFYEVQQAQHAAVKMSAKEWIPYIVKFVIRDSAEGVYRDYFSFQYNIDHPGEDYQEAFEKRLDEIVKEAVVERFDID